MSKRRINKQQSNRIARKQRELLQNKSFGEEKAHEGLVITRFGSHALIEEDSAISTHCSIRPSIGSLVAGDKVLWLQESEEQGVVISRFPRTSVLGRPDKKGQMKAIAANVTQVMIVVAPKPEISWPLLDSYLVMTESLGIKACIVVNKTDLPSLLIKERLINQYQPLGYDILFHSQYNKKDPIELEKVLKDETCVFVGQSGVGKSSIISSLLPDRADIAIGEISEISELGRHTTSNSTLYHLPHSGALIDSPGVREFGLWHMSTREIAKGYREFSPFQEHCKFRDCNHTTSPGCAIKKAVFDAKIAEQRYQNYVKISAQYSN